MAGVSRSVPRAAASAVARLGEIVRGQGVPVVRQLTASDCGAACLAMVLARFGHHATLESIRSSLGGTRDGASFASLLRVAKTYGLRGRAVRVDLPDLPTLGRGAILHWDLNHFVVLDRALTDGVLVVDPACGRRRLSLEETSRAFTGVALLLEPTDAFERRRRRTRSFARYGRWLLAFRPHWRRILLASLLLQGFALAGPALTGALIDRVLPRADHELLTLLTLALTVVVALHFLASLLRGHLLVHLRTLVEARTTTEFVGHLLSLPYAFFQSRSVGDLAMRLSSNAQMRDLLTGGALSAMLDGSLVLGYVVVLIAISPALAGAVLAVVAAQGASYAIAARRQRDLMARELASQASLQAKQIELLSGIETIKAMGFEERAGAKWSDRFVDALNASLERQERGATFEAVLATLRFAGPIAAMMVSASLVLEGRLSVGTMLALNALVAGLLGPVGNLIAALLQLQLLATHVERLEDVFETAPEQPEEAALEAPKLRGAIELSEVAFRYGPSSPNVLEGVSLSIRPGETLAIVGRSGGGKTTLANLLLGLYVPSAGTIRFDGIDLRAIELGSLRRQVGVVTQRPFLFATTIRQNIAYGAPEATLDAVVEAARMACIHDDVAAMPMGYETILADGGASLSGGQRQRLALARAFLSKPSILLLDEATSALDSTTELGVQRAIDALPCTKIIVAHRFGTIARADRVVVLEAGRVVEAGTHAELAARDGAYAALARAQGVAPPLARPPVPPSAHERAVVLARP